MEGAKEQVRRERVRKVTLEKEKALKREAPDGSDLRDKGQKKFRLAARGPPIGLRPQNQLADPNRTLEGEEQLALDSHSFRRCQPSVRRNSSEGDWIKVLRILLKVYF